ncbi:hypothetical protein IW262DRAFT_1467292 [Armillaria fumosa]|nr:hypothetical protein IW262DRAFT_1467292 [Armillaria fumosa]
MHKEKTDAGPIFVSIITQYAIVALSLVPFIRFALDLASCPQFRDTHLGLCSLSAGVLCTCFRIAQYPVLCLRIVAVIDQMFYFIGMRILILIFLLAANASGALDASDASGVPACSKELRTVLSIVWSCLATIFASTWLAVHPNVPGLDLTKEGSVWGIFDRLTIMCSLARVKLMLIAILAPEAMVGWAVRQFLVARKVRACKTFTVWFHHPQLTPYMVDSSKDHELKLVHGFFVSMGGFYYGKEKRLVTLKDVPKLLEPLAKVRAVDIREKSKGDALSKTIVVLQISWFVVQCCARAAQKLPITLLEMSALAFAVLSITSYVAWWEKPVDVLYQIRLEHSPMDTDQDGCTLCKVGVPSDVDPEPTAAPLSSARTNDDSDKFLGVNSSNPIELLPFPNTASFKPTAGYSSGWPHNSPPIDISALKDTVSPPRPPVYTEPSLLKSCFKTAHHFGKRALPTFTDIHDSVMGLIFGDDIVDRRVPTAATGAAGMSCCDGGTSTGDDDFSMRLLAVFYVGGLFAAIHCAAWSFSFPSHAEMVLWRTSSLAVIIGLVCGIGNTLSIRKRLFILLMAISSRLIQKVPERSRISAFTTKISCNNNSDYIILENNSTFNTLKDYASLFLSVLAIVIYIVARVTLIVLALLQLRSLPPLALRIVNWTTVIPHI